ncbi:NAD(P)H-binding protein [Chryseobacterium sp. A321]
MKVLVIGATGATGQDLVEQLLRDPDFDSVHVFSRRPLDYTDPKLHVEIVDFEKPQAWKSLLQGEVAFSCLGTTLKAAGGKQAQRKVDFGYQLDFAKGCRENHVPHFVLISSYGANENSKLFYSRMKGELEQEIRSLHFEKLTVFQPGMLERKKSDRPSEVLGATVLKFLNRLHLLQKLRPLKTSTLAQAMVHSTKIKSSGESVISLGSIFSFAKKP